MSTLVIVPARAGTEGLPGTHLLPLHGKPLIQWTMEYACNSIADEVLVLTDCRDVADLARSLDIKVIDDPPEMTFDVVAVLDDSWPLRRACDLDNCIELLYKNRFRSDAVVSVGRTGNSCTYNPFGGIYLSKTAKLLSRHRPQRLTGYIVQDWQRYAVENEVGWRTVSDIFERRQVWKSL